MNATTRPPGRILRLDRSGQRERDVSTATLVKPLDEPPHAALSRLRNELQRLEHQVNLVGERH
jgi:hypothetical protein